jgi:hypothetical protein
MIPPMFGQSLLLASNALLILIFRICSRSAESATMPPRRRDALHGLPRNHAEASTGRKLGMSCLISTRIDNFTSGFGINCHGFLAHP